MAFDYTDAPEQRGAELIPAGTVATGATHHPSRRSRREWAAQALQRWIVRDARLRARGGRRTAREAQALGTRDHQRYDRRPRQGCRNLPREVARDPRDPHAGLSPTTRARRRARPAPQSSAISTACASSPRSGSRRAARKTTAAARATPTATRSRRSSRLTARTGTRSSRCRALPGRSPVTAAVVVPIAKPAWAS